LPTQIHIDPHATKISGKPTVVAESDLPKKEKPTNKSKWMPWAIGGGVLLFIACLVVVIIVVGLSNLDIFNRSEPTSVAQNNAEIPTQPVGQGDLQQNGSPTQMALTMTTPETENLPTNTPQSAETIDKLPADIPVFTPNNGDVTTTTAEGNLMFSYSTKVDKSDVTTFFSEGMQKQNWELISTSEMSAQNMTMWAYAKDSRSVMIYVIGNQNNQTYIQIMIPNEGG
jgi:hypothetical protein